ncbi:MAG: hypothetical protein MZV49_03045 [Rhodopseudomonas palustris]|nr:hypothetical protein [Rhodopseudomonas palustris]
MITDAERDTLKTVDIRFARRARARHELRRRAHHGQGRPEGQDPADLRVQSRGPGLVIGGIAAMRRSDAFSSVAGLDPPRGAPGRGPRRARRRTCPGQYRDWLDPRRPPHPARREGRLPEARERPRPRRLHRDLLEAAGPHPGDARERVPGRASRSASSTATSSYGRNTTRPGWKTDHGADPHDPGAAAGHREVRGDDRGRPPLRPGATTATRGATCRPSSSSSSTSAAASASASSTTRSRTARPACFSTRGRSRTRSITRPSTTKIYELSLTLAEVAITRIPGEYNYDLSPSPRNAMLLADILQSPKKDVNPSYATHFLDYKGNGLHRVPDQLRRDATRRRPSIEDPVTGLRFFHFTLVPTDVNVDYYVPKSQFYRNFQVNVSLRSGETVVFQYSREFPLYFPEDSWERVKANGLAVEESFPVAEGQYKLSVLLTNTVGKQFSLLEQDSGRPAGTGPGRPSTGPLLGYKYETYQRDIHVPFKVLDQKLVVDPKKIFAATDSIAVLFSVLNVTDGPGQGRGGQDRGPRPPAGQPGPQDLHGQARHAPLTGKTLSIPYLIPAGELEPDYYDVVVTLAGPAGEVLDEKRDSMTVSPATAIGHPIANAKGIPLANQFLFRYMLAEQTEKTNRPDGGAGLLRGSLPACARNTRTGWSATGRSSSRPGPSRRP